jgi:hypothetical protein
LLVIECKDSIRKHESKEHDKPNQYAVDGALYYAKYLKEEFNIIAVGVSGTEESEMKVTTVY